MAGELTAVERLIQGATGKPTRLLFVIAGPSGVGKNTIIEDLLPNHPGLMDRIRTFTTRTRRSHEIDGKQYHFISRDVFNSMFETGRLLERTPVYGTEDLYSLPTDLFGEIPESAHLVIAEVDVVGTKLVKEIFPNAITIFVTAPPQDLIDRIRQRDKDDTKLKDLIARLETAQKQIQEAHEVFDYIVYNPKGHKEDSLREIEGIIRAERHRVRPGADLRMDFPDSLFKELLEELRSALEVAAQ